MHGHATAPTGAPEHQSLFAQKNHKLMDDSIARRVIKMRVTYGIRAAKFIFVAQLNTGFHACSPTAYWVAAGIATRSTLFKRVALLSSRTSADCRDGVGDLFADGFDFRFAHPFFRVGFEQVGAEQQDGWVGQLAFAGDAA